MDQRTLYLLAADGILLVHVLFVLFVLLGLLLIVAGYFYDWSWVRNPRFRLAIWPRSAWSFYRPGWVESVP